jgi:2'-deoxymugineic-acid 2'-dioxygenase / mugineic-acid 3-dioxygenase
VTNGALKNVEHRAATNSARARTSVATFIRPTADCLVVPAVEFVGKGSPPCYPTLTFSDYMRIYNVARLEPSLTQKDL